jgi:uncharacterized protein YjiS (DUF1127 family)
MRTDTFDSHVARATHPAEIDAAIKRARRLHAEQFNRLVKKAMAGVASLARELRRRREYSVAHETLLRMDDRGLQDIGISRGEITRAVYGPQGREGIWRGRSEAGEPIAVLDRSRPAPLRAANEDCPRDVA